MAVAEQEQPIDALVRAIDEDDVDRARAVLTRSPELKDVLNEPAPKVGFDSPPLHRAVARCNRAMIGLLLSAGADINARSRWWAGGFGVLDFAEAELVPFLIERGAIVDVHAAARLAMLERLDELVTADPGLMHARGGDGQTPLHFAATVEVARYLLQHGADIDARAVDHESTPVQYMVRDRQDVARFLISRGCRTDILLASAVGDLDLIRRHLEEDPASIRTTVSDRYFPQQNPRAGGSIYIWTLGSNKSAHRVAREFGRENAFELLMERSPIELKFATLCELGDEQNVRAMVRDQPNLVQMMTDQDREKLVSAAHDNDVAIARLMLDVGWPADARAGRGITALHWAAWQGNVEMTRELLEHGAPVNIVEADHKGTPLNWALYGSVHGWHPDRGDYPSTVEALLDAGAPLPPDLANREASPAVRDVLRRRF